MVMLNLGLNSDSINYKVALEVLGKSRQPFMQAIRQEREKPMPSQECIKYCEMRLLAIDELQDELKPSDMDTVEKILDQNNRLFC